MQGGVQIISKEVMKPSPHTFKTLKLSYIDISLPSIYIPFIFFYKADEPTGLNTSNHIQIPQILKHSLLATLPSFYPLAGELKHDIYVDYTDGASGFEFVEAKVHAQLKTALQGSTVKDMKLLLPSYCTTFDHAGWPLLVVQRVLHEGTGDARRVDGDRENGVVLFHELAGVLYVHGGLRVGPAVPVRDAVHADQEYGDFGQQRRR
ncbi:hypothetical protein SASPL_109551 [Salvia splendens]|uniref:Uncharacterized protein n=1 Tax=Salvia splendens TaxID=180675 RepID=A0A8X9A782_SALSN|nr:stemmadenine O-acetyltransferase-like isoform X2 [Salvia splendens]KAG6431472.1 hypothetical protein SASPL_109551 [Salvia splendens]